MKKKIFISLFAVLSLLIVGVFIAGIHIYKTADSLTNIIKLYQIDHLRHDMIISVQSVQSDLYTVGTPFGQNLDLIVENVEKLEQTAMKCSKCHHTPEVLKRIGEVQGIVQDYKISLSYYITASADDVRIQRLKTNAAVKGQKLLEITQDMSSIASNKSNMIAGEALSKINDAMIILYISLSLSLVLGVVISLNLIRRISHPINELVSATRAISKGEIGYTTSYNDSTEFGELAKSFNTMSTALKDSYDKIKESEWKFRILSEFSQDWEYWIQEDRKIIYISPSCERMTGYSKEEFIENPGLLTSIVHPEEKKLYIKHLESFRNIQHDALEFRIITKNREVKWISHVCAPIYSDDKYLGRRVSNRDITEKRRLEEQLSQAQKMESLGHLAGGVAHDFNNLLTAIMGYSSLLKEACRDSDPKVSRYIQNVLHASEKAKDLTQSLLAFSRKQIISPRSVNLNQIIRNISELLRRLLGEDIELRIKYSDDGFPVFADSNMLEQVIINLVTNARDAMPSGGILSLEVSCEIPEKGLTEQSVDDHCRYMTISVSDSGTGIDHSDLLHIFEPFFTTKEKGKGTGLGLALAYGIAKQHNGFIDVQTEKNKGTTFKVYLPVVEIEDELISSPESVNSETDLSGSETILIAEDEESVRELLRDVLQKQGYKVIIAVDGNDAIEKYNAYQDKIDLVVFDVIMPKKNGKEVYDLIKKENKDLKAIFISGYTKDILNSRGVYEEGINFISKPINFEVFLQKIRNILN